MTLEETLNDLLVKLFKDILEIEAKSLITEEWHGSATGSHDHDSGAMGKQCCDDTEKERFLSVLCNYDGALGRTCIHPVFRWRYDGSGS